VAKFRFAVATRLGPLAMDRSAAVLTLSYGSTAPNVIRANDNTKFFQLACIYSIGTGTIVKQSLNNATPACEEVPANARILRMTEPTHQGREHALSCASRVVQLSAAVVLILNWRIFSPGVINMKPLANVIVQLLRDRNDGDDIRELVFLLDDGLTLVASQVELWMLDARML
jgi:hypothetical protein